MVVDRYHISPDEARDIAAAAKKTPAILVGWQVNEFYSHIYSISYALIVD